MNNFLLKSELAVLTEAFVTEHGDLALEKLDGEDVSYERVKEALSSPPFLSSKKMVVLRGGSANKSITEHIDELVAAADDITELVIVEAKIDKRSVYYKTLKSQKGFREFGEQDENSLVKWLTQRAKDQGGELSLNDARKLVDKVGSNQQSLANELEKLLLYEPKINAKNIDLLVESSPRSTIFEMLESAFSGDTKRALKLYTEQRQLRVDPQAMLALISWQLHILALIKTASDRSPGLIASEGHVSPYVVNKSIASARRLTLVQLKKLIHDTLTLDIRLKSEPIDADSALQNLLISIAS